MVPSYGWGSTVSRLQSHDKETVYFLPLGHSEYLVLILSISERWKVKSTLELFSGFEPETPGLGIQHVNY